MEDIFIKLSDIENSSEPCTRVDCNTCPFDTGTDCKWTAFLNSLPKYHVEVEVKLTEVKYF